MRFDDLPESGNVEDRRGEGGGGWRLVAAVVSAACPAGAGGLSIGTIVVLGLIGWALGIDPQRPDRRRRNAHRRRPAARRSADPARGRPARRRTRSGRFVSRVLGSTEVVWKDIFAKDGKTYRAPTLVLYQRRDRGALRRLRAERDGSVLLPDRPEGLSRHVVLPARSRRASAAASGKSCQFAQAYVIAHEVGHHVQNLLGILTRAQQRSSAGRQQGGSQPHPGARRTAGRLLRRRLGQARERPAAARASRRSSSRATSRPRCAPRPRSATTRCSGSAGPRGARQLHPRHLRAAPALVQQRRQGRARSQAATRSRRRSSDGLGLVLLTLAYRC